LAIGGSFVTESIIGTRFTGQAVAEVQVGSGSDTYSAVIPRVTGSAYITGFNQFVLAKGDPFPQGFRLNA
jgi:proline racemase